MSAWLFSLGVAIGLGCVAGVRPSLMLVVLGGVSAVGAGIGVNHTFLFLEHWLFLGVFTLLALLESGLDKLGRWDRIRGRLLLPQRVAAGALAGAAVFCGGWLGVAVCAAAGGAAAWLSQRNKMRTRPMVAPGDVAVTFHSLWEDLYAFLGAALTLLFWPLGYVLGGFEGVVCWWAWHRRRRKYRELRRGGSV